jgi:hypothetical protein
MADLPELPVPRLYWKVTDPDGTIVQEGYATPFAAGAKAVQGKDQPQAETPDSEEE